MLNRMTTEGTLRPQEEHFLQGEFLQNGQHFKAVGGTWCNGTFNDKSVPIFPGVLQNTSTFLDMKVALYNKLKDIEPVMGDATGYWFSSPNQVLGNWGCLQTPILCPMENNKQLREDFKLRDPNHEELALVRQIFERVLSEGYNSSLYVRNKSSSGFPAMIVGRDYKISRFKVVSRNIHEFLSATAHGDYSTRFRLFGTYPAYTNGIRLQMDKISVDDNGIPSTKQRFTYRKSAVERGSFSDQDRIPISRLCTDIHGNIRSDVVPARVRSMYALCYDDNILMGILNNYLYNGAKKVCKPLVYEGELKLSKEIKQFLNFGNGHVFTLDKSQFGETFNPMILETFHQVIAKRRPLLAECIRNTIDAVVFLRAYDKGEKGVILTRPVFQKDEATSMRGSFKSGHGLVAILGKLLGLIDSMFIVRNALKSSFDLESFLANKDPRYRYYGSGDDTLFVVRDGDVAERIKQAIEAGSSLHKDEIEDVPKFLGNIYDNRGSISYDLSQFLEVMTGAERSWKLKPNHRIGIASRVLRAKRAPVFTELFAPLCDVYRTFYNFDLADYGDTRLALVSDDALFLYDPDIILYKPGLNIDPKLVAQEFETISADDVEDLWCKLN